MGRNQEKRRVHHVSDHGALRLLSKSNDVWLLTASVWNGNPVKVSRHDPSNPSIHLLSHDNLVETVGRTKIRTEIRRSLPSLQKSNPFSNSPLQAYANRYYKNSCKLASQRKS